MIGPDGEDLMKLTIEQVREHPDLSLILLRRGNKPEPDHLREIAEIIQQAFDVRMVFAVRSSNWPLEDDAVDDLRALFPELDIKRKSS